MQKLRKRQHNILDTSSIRHGIPCIIKSKSEFVRFTPTNRNRKQKICHQESKKDANEMGKSREGILFLCQES